MVWNRIALFANVHFVLGSPLVMDDLLRAGAHLACRAVVMATPHRVKGGRGGGHHAGGDGDSGDSGGGGASTPPACETQLLVDADTIFIYSALQSLNPDIHVVVELVHHANIQYVSRRVARAFLAVTRSC